MIQEAFLYSFNNFPTASYYRFPSFLRLYK